MVVQAKPSASFHCIGHSLGAHVCGFFANRMEKGGRHRRRVDRISGLDPAGIDWTTSRFGLMKVKPMAQPLPLDSRLDASDANLVDVIHTDGNFAGTMHPLGHVDFYVGRTEASLGSSQRGCGCTDNCDHAAAFKIFTESVMRPIAATKVVKCAAPSLNFTLEGCKGESVRSGTTMGYFFDKNEDTLGVVGVLQESTSVEMPCVGDKHSNDEEEDWQDWDEWEDIGEEEKSSVKTAPNEGKAAHSSTKVNGSKNRKIVHMSSQPRARQGSAGLEEDDEGDWLGSVVPACSNACLSIVLASAGAAIVCLVAVLCCYARWGTYPFHLLCRQFVF